MTFSARPEWASRQTVLDLFGLPHRHLTRLAADGLIRTCKFGGHKQSARLFKVADVEEAMAAIAVGREPRRPITRGGRK